VTVLKLAGAACIVGAAVWALLVAHAQGFLWDMLTTLVGSRRDARAARGSIFSEHWADVSGPFWLMVFGVALLLVATRS
jgi:hypothetical protein